MQSFLNVGDTYIIVHLNYIRARYIRLQFFPGNEYRKCNLATRYYRFETFDGECISIPERDLIKNVRTQKGYPLVIL